VNSGIGLYGELTIAGQVRASDALLEDGVDLVVDLVVDCKEVDLVIDCKEVDFANSAEWVEAVGTMMVVDSNLAVD